MNKYYPSTVQEAESLLTEKVADPKAIVIVKNRHDHPHEVIQHEGVTLAFSSLDDCRSLCHLLNEAYGEGHDDGRDEGYQEGYDTAESDFGS